VCKTCNKGWMNRLENDTKPILLKLIQAEPTLLGREQQTLVAQWVALKVMVTEWNRPLEAFIPKEDRRAFIDNLTIPPYLEMAHHLRRSRKVHDRCGLLRPSHGPYGPDAYFCPCHLAVTTLFADTPMISTHGPPLVTDIN
jgi:hypothetical protein